MFAKPNRSVVMTFTRCLAGAIVFLILAGVTGHLAGGDEPKCLSEADLIKQAVLLTDDELVAELGKRGISFAADEAALQRLQAAGASRAVLDAVRKAGQSRAAARGTLVTYQNVLELLQAGIDEAVILKRLEKSPTNFTLDETQIETLKKAGTSDKLLAATQNARTTQSRSRRCHRPGHHPRLLRQHDRQDQGRPHQDGGRPVGGQRSDHQHPGRAAALLHRLRPQR
jgi:hypothetical protein